MELTIQMRRSLIDEALIALKQKRAKRPLTMRRLIPAEDCEFPEDEIQEFPEDEIQEFPEE